MSDFFGYGKGRPSNTDESIQEVIQAISAYFPEAAKAIRGQYRPQAEAEMGIAREYTPQMGKLATETLGTVGRDMSKIGRELSAEEQMAAAKTEADIMSGPGQQTARAAVEAQKLADPEYFAQREAIVDNLDKVFASMGNDPTSLSKGEQEQIARGLGRTNARVSTPMSTISNAMTFGDAASKRRNEYANLINLRGNMTGALRSGLNMPAIASNRTVLPNFGQANYTGIQMPGVSNANTLGSSFMGGTFGIENTTKNKFAGGSLDALMKQSEIFKNMAGGVAGMAGCWVAREVYGNDNPDWLRFRKWLFQEAPNWLRESYLEYGERFAGWIKNKPFIKRVIKKLMDSVI